MASDTARSGLPSGLVAQSQARPAGVKRLRGSRTFYGVVATLLLVVFVVAALFFARAIRVEESESLAQNDAIARSVAASIEAREQGYLDVLRSYAGRFRFRESVKQRDRKEALLHLRQLRQGFPELDRVFLADPAGIVWATEPESPQIYGRSYAFRDWYRGVSQSWQPYMSEVYQTDLGHTPAVALAMPIRDVDGQVIGIIASVQRLDALRASLLPIQIPGGDIFVVDRKGQLVYHRTRAGAEHVADYVNVPVVRRLLEGRDGVAELENPVDGEVNLSAYRWLPAIGGEVHLTVDGVLQLRHAVATLEQTPNHRNVDIVRHVLGAGPRAVIHELPLTVDDEDVAARDLDRQQRCAQRVQALHRGDDADDLAVDVADRHRERHRRRVPEVGLVHLGHVRLPGLADAAVPVPEGIAPAVNLRALRLGRPHDPGGIGEEDAVEFREALTELAQMEQRLLPVPLFDAFAEPEASRIGAQHVEISLLSRLDRRRDAAGNRIVLGERLALLDADSPGEEESGHHEDDQKQGGHDPIERPRAAKPLDSGWPGLRVGKQAGRQAAASGV